MSTYELLSKENTPNVEKARDEMRKRFLSDFNQISLENLQKVLGEAFLHDYWVRPSEFDEEPDQEKYDSEEEYEAAYEEWELREEPECVWSTLFECKDNTLARILLEKVDSLHEIGIHLYNVSDDFDYRVMMFISGCGYDFFGAHWYPLYHDVLGWTKIKPEVTTAIEVEKLLKEESSFQNISYHERKQGEGEFTLFLAKSKHNFVDLSSLAKLTSILKDCHNFKFEIHSIDENRMVKFFYEKKSN